jgi:PAS domain S-box-containing protein
MVEGPQTGPDHVSAAAPEERWFRAVADYTNDWESWHAPDGRLLWVNPAVERITGYSVEECLAMHEYPLPMVDPQDQHLVVRVLASARQRTSGQNIDFRSRHRDGLSRWLSLSWQPMYGDPEEYLGFRTSIRDVTELHKLRDQIRLHAEHLEQLVQERTSRLRQLEERQRQMEKLAALGQLAAGVAHEINNPLAGMRNAFELIKSDLPPDHAHFELLELIDREIDRISGITHQMYQLYRRNPQMPTDFAMDQIVGEVILLLENLARKHGVRLTRELPSSPVKVKLPEGEVKQILYNILGNAIQASPPGEEVSVGIGWDSQEVAVRVMDHGPGIPAKIRDRIFDPFFSTKQADTQTGMGLGLSVSRSLIEAMGGRIELTSHPGRGSLFTAIFPHRIETSQEVHHV